MKVFLVENENPLQNSSGGIMTYIKNLSEFLLKKGVKVVLVGSGLSENEFKKTKHDFLISSYISVSEHEISNIKYLLKLLFKQSQFGDNNSVIFHSQRPDMLFPFVLFKRKSILICSLHGAHDRAVHHKKGILFGKIYDILQYFSFKKVFLLIAVDKGTRDYYIAKYSWIKDKITVIPPGINLEKFVPMEKEKLRRKWGFYKEEKIIIYVGRLEKEKNLGMLMESFKIVKDEIKSTKLILIGTGREEKKLKSMVNELDLKDVFFLGIIQNEKIPEILNCSDVLALCSLYEGSPIIVKEALSCCLPVVSVDVGDVKEIINDIDGCYISQRNKMDFSKKIIKALKENKRVSIEHKIDKFDYRETGRLTMNLYKVSMA